MKYPEQYIGFVVSKKLETNRCDPLLNGLTMPAAVASSLSSSGGIRELISGIPPEVALRREARKHQSLADHTRLRILWALSKMDLCPCVLKVVAEVSDSKLSYHLRILESGRLIRARRTKNWRVYSITKHGMEAISRDTSKRR